MNRQQRRLLLADRVAEGGELGFADAAAMFGVSEMTIRRDVEALEAQGRVRRVPGGMMSIRGGNGYEPPFSSRVMTQAREKADIARAVADLLVPGSRVMIDTGSTGLAVAKAVRGRGLGLTVLTPNLLVAMQLVDEPDTSVFLTGGELRQGEMSLIGPATVQSLTAYNLDTYVMSVAGVDAERGISDYNVSEAATKRAAVAASDRVIVCVDASKLDKVFLTNVAAFAEVDVLVTDGEAGNRSVLAARDAGVEVVLVAH
ncbi:MAG: DeoR/GlpR family DNA-binding transcription regulator [Propioniciclava sp.]|uniref:DeoR/GlpR family DNA-binding transcription regulator n=1 Tax=Propioniciclava sp. TaxID=2038686 RepID=UPI0039E5EBB8